MKKRKRKYRRPSHRAVWRVDRSCRPQNYPQRPRSKKNVMLKPIKRS